MLPDDIFRSRLQATITALRYWAPSIADSAHLEETENADYWRLLVTPAAASACPFELILHADQRYDLAVANETYEARPIDSFDWCIPFANAVADGNVVQRRWISRFTGIERLVETVVMLPGGALWREGNAASYQMPPSDDDGTELREKRFLPYRR